MSVQIWQHIYRWMNVSFTSPLKIQQNFSKIGEVAKGKKSKQFQHLIWLTMTWSLWCMRNNILFKGDYVSVLSIVDKIIYILCGFGL
jgi:hypothetical protein